MSILYILVSFAVAALSGLGVGSAGLFTVFLTVVMQLPQLTAQGINLAFFLFSSGAALTVHLSRTMLLWGAILLSLIGGTVGSFLGVLCAGILPETALRGCFGAFLILSGGVGLFQKKEAGQSIKSTTGKILK